jgi:GNAT superfamily N-acetyltransferase
MSEQPRAASIALRAAVPGDVETILGFITELAEYENLAHEVVATPADLGAALFGDSPVAEVVIADCDGSAAGFALFFKSYSTFLGRPGLYLEDLYVTPKARGRGVGKALLRHLATLARSRKYGRIEWAVLDWNSPAIDFYDRMGARPLSEWITYRLTGEALDAAGAVYESRAMPADE